MTQFAADMKEFSEETREASPANFLLKIESFSSLSNYGINKYESRAFEAGDYKWKLVIHPDGYGTENGGFLSVYFSIAETDTLPVGWEVNAIFTFFVHNQLLNNYLCFRGMTRRFNAVNPKWGFSKLMLKEGLMDPRKGFVVDDSCVFGAEVFVVKTQRINECLSLRKYSFPTKREWKISNFYKFENEWSSEEFFVGGHKWKVEFYPKGESTQVKDRYVSVWIEYIVSENSAPHLRVKAEVSFGVKNELNSINYARKRNYWFTPSSPSRGFHEFMPIDEMRSEGYLVEDCCILEVEICVQAVVLDAPKI